MTHNYTHRYWGHDFTFSPETPEAPAHMMGWGEGIIKGDYLILPNAEKTTRYLVVDVKYFSDPPDMWSADVMFAPRMENY